MTTTIHPCYQRLSAKVAVLPSVQRREARSVNIIFQLFSTTSWSSQWPPVSKLKIVSAAFVVSVGCPWMSTRLIVRRCEVDLSTRRMWFHHLPLLQLQQWSAVHVKVYIFVWETVKIIFFNFWVNVIILNKNSRFATFKCNENILSHNHDDYYKFFCACEHLTLY